MLEVAPYVHGFNYHIYNSVSGSIANQYSYLSTQLITYAGMLPQSHKYKTWQTETSGATEIRGTDDYDNETYYTAVGRFGNMDDQDKAIATARYMYLALTQANSSAFLWWGLTFAYPDGNVMNQIKNPYIVNQDYFIEYYKDQGLVLVDHFSQAGSGDCAGMPIYVLNQQQQITKKYYAFKQFSYFIKPEYKRIDTSGRGPLLVSAYKNPDAKEVILVAINPSDSPVSSSISGVEAYSLFDVRVTDQNNNFSSIGWNGQFKAKSITTLRFVTPIFVSSKDASCSGHNVCFTNIQNGIDCASAATQANITQESYNENIILDFDEVIALKGGWNTNFTSNSSYTTINGSITITNGTMILENIILK